MRRLLIDQPPATSLRNVLGRAPLLVEKVPEIVQGTGASWQVASESSIISRRGDATLVASGASVGLRKWLLGGTVFASYGVDVVNKRDKEASTGLDGPRLLCNGTAFQ